ncbi:SRPBCC family protein [Ferrovibrio sp.]|uniref:SRPBCC family protein n=1 Tax=Ferrovibrio sp. TaxID=1917215 RepID=UPI00311FAB1A
MSASPSSASSGKTGEQTGRLDLTLTRDLAVPPALVWKVWTTPEHLMPWFCPRPWMVTQCEIELRPGGKFFTVMRGPEGQEFPNLGIFLELVENRRLVFTDTLHPGWRPATNPFFTAIVTMEEIAGGTRYTATALHKDDADRKKHEEMGFHDGWATAATQMEDYAKSLL